MMKTRPDEIRDQQLREADQVLFASLPANPALRVLMMQVIAYPCRGTSLISNAPPP